MNPEQLLTHFDRIAEAPDAVPRLRRFIFDLAVRGKLVEQDPNDEPASELLRLIHADNAKSTRIGAKRRGARAKGADRRNDFVAPNGWELITLGELAQKITDGAHKTPTYVDKGIPFISVKDFSGGSLDFTYSRHIPPDEHELLYKRCDPRRGDILIGRIGTLGKAVLVDTDQAFSLFVSVGLIRFNHDFTSPLFLRLLLNSPFVESAFDRIKVGGGTHTNKLNLGDLHTVVLPLPPLAEQRRIVAKVDELMGLCDRLEAAQGERERRRDALAAASLHRLNHPADAGHTPAFREHARFHLQHLPRTTTRPDQIPHLRQTILNLAVRGQLVPQDPNDEPIQNALTQANARRAALARMKRTKHKRAIECNGSDIEDQLPKNWIIERLGNLVDPENTISYGVLVPGPDVLDGIPFVRAQDLTLTDHPERPNKTIAPEIEKPYARTRLSGGEILLCVVGSIGKLGIAPPTWAGANIARAVARIKPIPELSRDYLLTVLRAQATQRYFTEATRTLAQPTLNVSLIEKTPIPLPPLAEQHRIVAKVDELMAVCDALEAQLGAAQTESRRLLESLLNRALAPST